MRMMAFVLCATALCVSGCQRDTNAQSSEGSNRNADAVGKSGRGPEMLCLFEKSDTKDWHGKANQDQSVSVAGKVHVGDPKYRPMLFQPKARGSTAQLILTAAENSTGQAPADGWWDVSYTIPDNGSIQTVEIWCDLDTMLASFPVRRS